jgi:hypothetical protein
MNNKGEIERRIVNQAPPSLTLKYKTREGQLRATFPLYKIYSSELSTAGVFLSAIT